MKYRYIPLMLDENNGSNGKVCYMIMEKQHWWSKWRFIKLGNYPKLFTYDNFRYAKEHWSGTFKLFPGFY